MGGLYLLLEELGGEPFAAYKEFGRQIVVAALERVSHIIHMYSCSFSLFPFSLSFSRTHTDILTHI